MRSLKKCWCKDFEIYICTQCEARHNWYKIEPAMKAKILAYQKLIKKNKLTEAEEEITNALCLETMLAGIDITDIPRDATI